MSDHEDILMGLDAVTDRLNDAISLVGATRASYLDLAQKYFSLEMRIKNLESGYAITADALDEAIRRIQAVRDLCGTRIAGSAAKAVLEVLDGA